MNTAFGLGLPLENFLLSSFISVKRYLNGIKTIEFRCLVLNKQLDFFLDFDLFKITN